MDVEVSSVRFIGIDMSYGDMTTSARDQRSAR